MRKLICLFFAIVGILRADSLPIGSVVTPGVCEPPSAVTIATYFDPLTDGAYVYNPGMFGDYLYVFQTNQNDSQPCGAMLAEHLGNGTGYINSFNTNPNKAAFWAPGFSMWMGKRAYSNACDSVITFGSNAASWGRLIIASGPSKGYYFNLYADGTADNAWSFKAGFNPLNLSSYPEAPTILPNVTVREYIETDWLPDWYPDQNPVGTSCIQTRSLHKRSVLKNGANQVLTVYSDENLMSESRTVYGTRMPGGRGSDDIGVQ